MITTPAGGQTQSCRGVCTEALLRERRLWWIRGTLSADEQGLDVTMMLYLGTITTDSFELCCL